MSEDKWISSLEYLVNEWYECTDTKLNKKHFEKVVDMMTEHIDDLICKCYNETNKGVKQ